MEKRAWTVILMTVIIAGALLGFSACGSSGSDADVFEYGDGDYTLEYVGNEITEDADGNEVVVLKYDFTNSSNNPVSMYWSVMEQPSQNGEELEPAVVFVGESDLLTADASSKTDVEPGDTKEVQTTWVLKDTESDIDISLEALLSNEKKEMTVSLEK